MGERDYWRAGNMLYPLPAVMVSCQRGDERPNIITVAWVGTVCSDPAMVYISVRPSRYSYDIIKESKEFVINLTTEDLARATDICGVKSGRDMDKFKDLNLTPMPSKYVSAPSIAESPVNIECRVTQILPLGTHDMFLAEVLGVTIDTDCIGEDGGFHLSASRPLVYSHGAYYGQGDKVGKFGFSVEKNKTKKKRAADSAAASEKNRARKKKPSSTSGKPVKFSESGKSSKNAKFSRSKKSGKKDKYGKSEKTGESLRTEKKDKSEKVVPSDKKNGFSEARRTDKRNETGKSPGYPKKKFDKQQKKGR